MNLLLHLFVLFIISSVSVTGQFSITKGKIIDPNGNYYFAKGINVYDFAIGEVSTGSDGAPLTSLFPGINFIRLACFTYNDPSYYSTFISQMSSLGIVVELEHHEGAGGGVPPLTGNNLTSENAWFSALASAYANNPYVWFGTLNEPSGPGDELTAEQVSNYNAIRNAGCPNPILLEVLGDYADGVYTIGAGHGLIADNYTSLTNIIWDLHYYNWLSGYSSDLATNENLVNSYCQQAQTITSADGIVPVIIGEYGISTDGNNVDPGGNETCQAVQNSVGSYSAGCSAWNWYSDAASDNLVVNNDSLTSYGQQVAEWIADVSYLEKNPLVYHKTK